MCVRLVLQLHLHVQSSVYFWGEKMSSCEPDCVAEALHPIFPWHHYWLLIFLPPSHPSPLWCVKYHSCKNEGTFFPCCSHSSWKTWTELSLVVCDTVNKGLGGHTFSISSYFDSSAGMGGEERNKNKNKNKTSSCCSLLWEKELINAKGKQLEKRPLQGGLSLWLKLWLG